MSKILLTEDEKIELIKRKMHIDRYNESLKNSSDRQVHFDIEEICKKDFGEEIPEKKDTGWYITKLDYYALDDFVWNRSTTRHNTLQYALRYYIPIMVYAKAIDFYSEYRSDKKSNMRKSIIRFAKTLDVDIMDAINHDFAISDTVIDEVKIAWKLHVIDYISVVIFSELTKISIQDLCCFALREYLLDVNYQNAKNLIKVLENNKNNNIKLYGELNDEDR